MSGEAAITGFDPELAGRRAEADGGFATSDGAVARAEFVGTLTGEFMEEGAPPSRWYLLANLVRKPDWYEWDQVWCEVRSLFLEG